jgi:hypothetical protein
MPSAFFFAGNYAECLTSPRVKASQDQLHRIRKELPLFFLARLDPHVSKARLRSNKGEMPGLTLFYQTHFRAQVVSPPPSATREVLSESWPLHVHSTGVGRGEAPE